MKVKLSENEIAEIIKEWAMQFYRTRNVSVMYEIDLTPAELVRGELSDDDYVTPAKLNSVGIEVEVTMDSGDYTGASSVLANEAIQRVQKKHGVNNENDPQTISIAGPSLDGNSLP